MLVGSLCCCSSFPVSSFGATLARSRSRWIEHHFSGLAFRFNATLRGDSRLVVPLSRQSSRISKFADLYAAIAYEIFVILEKDVPFFRQAEILDFRVFATGDQDFVDICAPFVFDDFESI